MNDGPATTGIATADAPVSRQARGASRWVAWGTFLGFAGLVLGTQELAVDASYFLRQRNLLRVTIYVAAVVAVALIADRIWFVTRPRAWWQWLLFAIGFALLGVELCQLQLKEDSSEAFHCVEFLVLTLLAGQAATIDRSGGSRFLLAFAVVASFGLLDEGVQSLHILRRFDWMDVLLDARVAFYGVLTMPALVPRRARLL